MDKMLPPRSPIQRSKSSNTLDENFFSTHQSSYSQDKAHGNLINHFGNNAYINNASFSTPKLLQSNKKHFLAPSYHNLTASACISNRASDDYSNNYRTSEENPLHRPLNSAPTRTTLNYLYKIDKKSVAPLDKSSLYEQNYFNQMVNDHFVSDRWLKTETINLRDEIACLMEMSDYMRNMSFDINARQKFDSHEPGLLDKLGQECSKLNNKMDSLLYSYNKMNSNALELKKMVDNLEFSENIVQKNLCDRSLRPNGELKRYIWTENSIKNDRTVLQEQKLIALKTLQETQFLLNSMENFVHKNLDSIFEEAKVLIMSRLFRKEYESRYLCDSNGHIKKNAKIPLKPVEWLNLSQAALFQIEDLKVKADKMTENIIRRIDSFGEIVSGQWYETHLAGIEQIKNGLKTQNKLRVDKYDNELELVELNQVIAHTRDKFKHVNLKNHFELAEMEGKLKQSKIDPYFDTKRETQNKYANNLWRIGYELTGNLREMYAYRKELLENNQTLRAEIGSNGVGLKYDRLCVVEPRSYQIATQPSINLVQRSFNI